MEIRITRVSKDYFSEDKKITALSDVDLTIPSNRIFTLLVPVDAARQPCSGASSAGDAGYRRDRHRGRKSFFKGKEIFVPPEKRGLNMVFQSYAIWPHMNVFNNVAYPSRPGKFPERKSNEEWKGPCASSSLRVSRIGRRRKLSGGQQQRVALARALVAEPKVILFDEPLSNLDAKLREETRKELRAFLTELKITAVYVTHDRIEALSLSDTIAVMKDGRIVEIGTPRRSTSTPSGASSQTSLAARTSSAARWRP